MIVNNLKKQEHLRLSQQSFFLLGFTLPWLGDREFPFSDEQERTRLWKRHKVKLFASMYDPASSFPAARDPEPNALRPGEYWKRDERKLILNDANFSHETPEGHRIYNKQPLLETDLEALTRLVLVTDRDLDKASMPDFKIAEAEAFLFRDYLLAHKTARVPMVIPATAPLVAEKVVEAVPIASEAAAEPGPPLPEYGGQCPRCYGKLAVHSPAESICVGCGIIFPLEGLGKIWVQVDSYKRERRAGHRVGED